MTVAQSDELIYTEEHKSHILGFLEDFLHNLFKKSDNETRANLSTFEWIIYIGTLLTILIMPFLYSRLTTENFLTPKEFFSRIAIAVLGGMLCVYLFKDEKVAFARTSLDMPIVLFFGFCALSVLWNINGISAIRDLRGVFAIMLLFPVIVNVFRSRWQVELLLWIVVFTGIATATIGFMETYNFYFKFDWNGIHYVKDEVLARPQIIDNNAFYIPLFPQLASPDYAMGSVVSTFGNRNYLGTFAMFVAFIPLAFFFYYRGLGMKIVSIGLFGWLLYGLYSTRCRAALIGLAIGFVFMLIVTLLNDRGFKFVKRYRALVCIVALLFALGLIISAVTIQSETMYDKIKLTFTLNRLVSNTYERMWVWFGNNCAFLKNPFTFVFGNGFGSFKHFFPLKEGEIFSEANRETFTAVTFRQAHNDWIQIFSELGIVGMMLFLFILKRFFGSIQGAVRRNVFGEPDGHLDGDHMLIICLASGTVAQLFAALPDFPYHRIETAVLAVVYMSLVPVLTETDFFKTPLRRRVIDVSQFGAKAMMFAAILGTILNYVHEIRCWQADEKVREAEMIMTHVSNGDDLIRNAGQLLIECINSGRFGMAGTNAREAVSLLGQALNNTEYLIKARRLIYDIVRSDASGVLAADVKLQQVEMMLAQATNNKEAIIRARQRLIEAIELDPLPGDPYNKMSSWIEQYSGDGKQAIAFADKAWNNINFNARSTYHSVLFRRMHIYYHLLQDLPKAYKEAIRALDLTAGDARSIYYLYAGKIGADIIRNGIPCSPELGDIGNTAKKYLTKAMAYPQFENQAMASLSVLEAQLKDWENALAHAKKISELVGHRDPVQLSVIGIAASNLGDYKYALQAYNTALKLNPDNPAVHRDLGGIYIKLGNLTEARNHLELALASKNSPEELRKEVSELLKQLDANFQANDQNTQIGTDTNKE